MKQLLTFLLFAAAALPLQAQTYTSPSGDLQVTLLFNASHDSSQCVSQLQVLYDVVRQNSFMGEVIEIKDNFGNLVTSVPNSTGANPFVTTIPAMFDVRPDFLVTGGFVMMGTSVFKVIASTDTIYNINNNYMFPVPDACEYDMVSGKLYVDSNSDCVFNGSDVALNAVPVSIQNNLTNGSSSTWAYSNASGDYSLQVQESWMTSVVVEMPSYYQFAFSLPSCQTAGYSVNTLPASGLDFALVCGSQIDVQSSAFSSGVVRPNVPFLLHPYVNNMGCDDASGVLKLVLDSRVDYDPLLSSNPANSVSGDTLYWNFTNLTNLTNNGYWNSFFGGVHLTPDNSVNIGDVLCFDVSATVPANDVNPNNNSQTICLTAVNSYDPNIKSVEPQGAGAEGFIPATTPELTYTVQFQNTGNAPAINIYILDTIDTDLDINTFHILSSSHNMQAEWLSSRVLRFSFNNINLPDSATNEPESHGYLRYQISPLLNSVPGTQFTNTAHIFFDNNPAVVTNTTVNTIEFPISTEFVAQTSLWKAYPNPVRDVLFLQVEQALMGNEYRIFDLLGRTLLSGNLSQPISSLPLAQLPAGVYGLQIGNDKPQMIRKE